MTPSLNTLPVVIPSTLCDGRPNNSTGKTSSPVDKAIKEFFTSQLVQNAAWLGHAVAGLGYFTGVISPDRFRPLALGFMFSSMIFSTINVCTASSKQVTLKSSESESNWINEYPDPDQWDRKTFISFFSRFGFECGKEVLRVGLLALSVGTSVAEIFLYPALAVPRICILICEGKSFKDRADLAHFRMNDVEKTSNNGETITALPGSAASLSQNSALARA